MTTAKETKAFYTGWLQNKEVSAVPIVVTEILPQRQGSDLYCKAYLEADPNVSGVFPVNSYALGQVQFHGHS
jgi:hypothetical protein